MPVVVAALIARLNAWVALADVASVTEVVKLKVPVCEVVPEITPLLLSRESPWGRVPVVICHWYGAEPPVASRLALYGTPDVPAASDKLEIASLLRGTTLTIALATMLEFVLMESRVMARGGRPPGPEPDPPLTRIALAAVIVTLVEDVTEGAVNRPLLEIAPALALQVTAVLLVDVNVAANCNFSPEETVATEGETLILIAELFVAVVPVEDWEVVDDEIPEQPVEIQVRVRRRRATPERLRHRISAVVCW